MSHIFSFGCYFDKPAPLQFPLINRFYKGCGYSLSCGRLEQVYCLRETGQTSAQIIAAVRFIPQQQGHYVLRNLCVSAHWRRRGLARFLIREAFLELTQTAKVTCYCYALPHLQAFYSSIGFVPLKSEDVPEDIAKSYDGYSQQQPALVLMKWN